MQDTCKKLVFFAVHIIKNYGFLKIHFTDVRCDAFKKPYLRAKNNHINIVQVKIITATKAEYL